MRARTPLPRLRARVRTTRAMIDRYVYDTNRTIAVSWDHPNGMTPQRYQWNRTEWHKMAQSHLDPVRNQRRRKVRLRCHRSNDLEVGTRHERWRRRRACKRKHRVRVVLVERGRHSEWLGIEEPTCRDPDTSAGDIPWSFWLPGDTRYSVATTPRARHLRCRRCAWASRTSSAAGQPARAPTPENRDRSAPPQREFSLPPSALAGVATRRHTSEPASPRPPRSSASPVYADPVHDTT
jgi:hypothetical protein